MRNYHIMSLERLKTKGIEFWQKQNNSSLKFHLSTVWEQYRDYPDFTYLYESVYSHGNHTRYHPIAIKHPGSKPFFIPFGRGVFLLSPLTGEFYMVVSLIMCIIMMVVCFLVSSKFYSKLVDLLVVFDSKFWKLKYKWYVYPLTTFTFMLVFLVFVFVQLDLISPTLRHIIVIIDVYQNPLLVTATLATTSLGFMMSIWGLKKTEAGEWAAAAFMSVISWVLSLFFWHLVIMQYISILVYIVLQFIAIALVVNLAYKLFGFERQGKLYLLRVILYTPCALCLNFVIGYFSVYALLLVVSLDIWAIALFTVDVVRRV